MAFRENTFTTFNGRIDGHTQKAVRFMADGWADFEWLPRKTKKGDPIIEILQHDHDSGEAKISIADWLCKSNGWET